MLHQVKKGVWEHLLNLFQQLMESEYESRTVKNYLTELDARFAFVPRSQGLKSFSKGITQLSQITASEYFQIMNVSHTVFTDFIYYLFALIYLFVTDISGMWTRFLLHE
jgi:hypothetical protein